MNMNVYCCPKCQNTELKTFGVATFQLDGRYGTVSNPTAFEDLPETRASCPECGAIFTLGEARAAAAS
jgi:hypothetical protein